MFTQENRQNYNKLAQQPDDTRGNNKTPTTVDLFIDNRLLHTASVSPTTNVKRLQKAFKNGIIWAEWTGMKIDMNKVDCICFT